MAKDRRGGSSSSAAPTRPSSSSRSTRTSSAPPPAPSPARRYGLIAAGIAAVLVMGGILAFGIGGVGGSGATPTPIAIAAAPALSISPQEADARWDAGALLLDVREDAEWAAGHVPGATHIPLGQLAARVGELPTDQAILVICRSGNRSQEGRDILLAAGLTPVTSVDGGVRAWRDAGLPYEGQVI